MSGLVVWFTGLPSSGKTTLAEAVKNILRDQGKPCCLLDSDEVRTCLFPPLGYDHEARENFYRTLGALAASLSRQDLIVLVAATAHRRSDREAARAMAPGRFLEVFLDVSAKECEERDAKGLYARARAGEIVDFPGVQEGYERSGDAALRITPEDSRTAAARVVELVVARQAASNAAAAERR